MKKQLLLALIGISVNQAAWAALDDDLAKVITENVYNIQATCSSSGQFTAKALEQSRNIRGVIEKLKNNPACKGLSDSINSAMESLIANLETVQRANSLLEQNTPAGDELKNVGQEMQALRSFSSQLNMTSMNAPQAPIPGFLPAAIATALNKSAMKMQRIQLVSKGNEDIESNPNRVLSKEAAQQIINARRQNSLAARSGINTLSSTMDIIMSNPKYKAAAATGGNFITATIDKFAKSEESCLDDQSAAFLASGFTQMLAAFVTGSEVSMTGQTTAHALNKIVTFISRDKKYINAIRSLYQAEFYTTLSCLTEMTSEGYCAVEDAQLLLNDVKKDFKLVEKTIEPTTAEKKAGAKSFTVVEAEAKNFTSLLQKGPMAGHYILSHQLNIVTDWINKIQFGVEPQLPREADFQVETFKNSLEPFILMKQILGNFNNKLAQLKNTTSKTAQQNLVLEMLLLVNDSMTSKQNAAENFFLRVHPPPRMPFALMGMKYSEMPKEVFEAQNNIVMDPVVYLTTYFQKMPQFENPLVLAETIKFQAEDIFKKADYLAQQYFLQFFIPDETAVVSESMVGMNRGDVRSALEDIDIYVKDFSLRMQSPGGDLSILPLAEELRARIGVVLAHYKRFREYGQELVEMKNNGQIAESKFQEKLTLMSREFIQDVYDQFFIKKMRAGWLTYRLMTIVKKDYSLAMQKRSFSNAQLQDLLLATGLESLMQIFSQSGVNFATAEMDLAQARDIYWKNLHALEMISAAPMANYINEHRLRADPNILTQKDLWKAANKYAYHAEADLTPTDDKDYAWWRKLKGLGNNVMEGLFGGFGVFNKDVDFGWPQLSQQVFSTKLPDLTDTTDGGSEKIYAKNCAVVLAFNELRPYWHLCKKATLYSSFYDKEKYKDQPGVLNFLENHLSLNFLRAAYSHLDPNENIADAKDKAKAKTKLNQNRRTRICALRDHYRKNYVIQITAALRRDNEVYTNEYTKIPERPAVSLEPAVNIDPNAPERQFPNGEQTDTDAQNEQPPKNDLRDPKAARQASKDLKKQ